MQLDMRNATFAFLGAWNQSIFHPGWVAHHLHQIPVGKEITGFQVSKPGQPSRDYIEEIGLLVTQTRLDVYINEFNGDLIRRAEQLAVRIFEVLPHTPFGAFGVNFMFIEDGVNEYLINKLKTNDEMDQHSKIIGKNIIDNISISDDIVLNFSREVTSDNINFRFNYHHAEISVDNAKDKLSGAIQKYFDKSLKYLKDLYNLSDYTVIGHDFRQHLNAQEKSNAE